MIDEGIIKFNYHCEDDNCIESSSTIQKLIEIHKNLFNLGLIGFDKVHQVSYGNSSFRNNLNNMVITASDCSRFEKISLEHLCIVKKVELSNNNVIYKGEKAPSSESMTHYQCYQSSDEINAVIHIHNKLIWNNYLNENKLKISKEIPYGTPEMALAVKKIIEEQPSSGCGIAMEGHEDGVIYVANSLESAMNLAIEDLKTVSK